MSGLVPPSDPKADPRPFHMAVVDAITALQQPGQPMPACSVTTPTAPPAANWTGCVAYFADLKVLAVSDGVAWIRQDTGAQV